MSSEGLLRAAPPAAAPSWRPLCVLALLLVLLLLWDASGLDLVVERCFAGAHGYAWRDAAWARALHEAGRLLAWAGVIALAINLRWPLVHGPSRRERLWWLLATLACASIVPLLKARSLTSCPWDLAEFGGIARYVSHWSPGVADGGGGRCFPAGHVSAAAAFAPGWFALRRTRPRLAAGWLAGVVVLALAFGALQVMRGAHHPSHVGWALWLCGAGATLLAQLWRPAGAMASPRIRRSTRKLPHRRPRQQHPRRLRDCRHGLFESRSPVHPQRGSQPRVCCSAWLDSSAGEGSRREKTSRADRATTSRKPVGDDQPHMG